MTPRAYRRHNTHSSWLLSLVALLTTTALLLSSLPTARAESGIGGTKKLYTSSVAYCSPPEVLIVDNVELTLYPENSTLEFELAAASVPCAFSVMHSATTAPPRAIGGSQRRCWSGVK